MTLPFALMLLQASSLPFYAVIISLISLFVAGGAAKFFISYGTRLAMVEKESKETKDRLEKHAAELVIANQQVALVAAALEGIKSALSELKQDVKLWIREQSHRPASAE